MKIIELELFEGDEPAQVTVRDEDGDEVMFAVRIPTDRLPAIYRAMQEGALFTVVPF